MYNAGSIINEPASEDADGAAGPGLGLGVASSLLDEPCDFVSDAEVLILITTQKKS